MVKGVFSLLKGSSCRLFLHRNSDETNVTFLAAVRGGDILDLVAGILRFCSG
jgi:hypothetical protein